MPQTNNRRLLAEWENQSAVMLTWPHDQTDWAWILGEVDTVYGEISRAISRHERLLIVYRDAAHKQHIENVIADSSAIKACVFVQCASNDSWARDHGPISVMQQGKPVLLDFQFNGWGGKYESTLDNAISKHIHDQGIFKCVFNTLTLILEGGSIESDGVGTLLTTEQCLLTPTRNPGLSKSDIEKILISEFGLKRILWLSEGHLAGDDTDAHIDTLARFCNPQTIAYCTCDDTDDEHYTGLKAMEKQLKAFRTASNQPYTLVPLPIPAARYAEDGRRLPATYANFLIINKAVLVPVYDDSHDAIALENLRTAFPQHEIIAINCVPIIKQYGSLHCLTMQLAAGVI
ncbi:MAG: agmatine deiminase family protein [Gammaproteobacteria bacterium]|nr:agmatine deiminase family protein [Gammaproteobacteria bacterium]